MSSGRLRKISECCHATVILGGIAVLAGWHFEISALKTVLPGLISMKANTAIGLIALASSGMVLANSRLTNLSRTMAICFSMIAFILGVLTLSEYLLRIDSGRRSVESGATT
ncbi:MAG: hypothetical protein H7301_03015 [Cryobacterium sp.]|nr:hypothetical protein [Oligoflexia bacterium]